MGKQPTNLLPQSFKQAAEQKSDVGVLKPVQFANHKGQPGMVFQTNIREKGEVQPANTFMTDAQMKNAMEKLMTDHLKHEHLDQNMATLRNARADLKAIVETGLDLPNVSDKDISRMVAPGSSPANHGIKGDPIGDLIERLENDTKKEKSFGAAAAGDQFDKASKGAVHTAQAVEREIKNANYISPSEGADIAGNTSRISKLTLNLTP